MTYFYTVTEFQMDRLETCLETLQSKGSPE